MRRSLTLIELVFSMVIIALAFTVLPKMMQLSSKINIHAVQEEALYNAIAYIGLIKSTAWDEQNTRFDDILITSGDNAYECPVDYIYRRGGFYGSRNCRHDQDASATLGSESDEPPYDDMDDFVSISVQNSSGTRKFDLNVSTYYVEDLALDEEKFSKNIASAVTNTKYIEINVSATARQGAVGTQLGSVYFIGCNIGQIKINRYRWH